jgi:hypothetical protein
MVKPSMKLQRLKQSLYYNPWGQTEHKVCVALGVPENLSLKRLIDAKVTNEVTKILVRVRWPIILYTIDTLAG